ncbi:hypothetical protein HDU96_010418, partial [Phlyctochytrium bullatum]
MASTAVAPAAMAAPAQPADTAGKPKAANAAAAAPKLPAKTSSKTSSQNMLTKKAIGSNPKLSSNKGSTSLLAKGSTSSLSKKKAPKASTEDRKAAEPEEGAMGVGVVGVGVGAKGEAKGSNSSLKFKAPTAAAAASAPKPKTDSKSPRASNPNLANKPPIAPVATNRSKPSSKPGSLTRLNQQPTAGAPKPTSKPASKSSSLTKLTSSAGKTGSTQKLAGAAAAASGSAGRKSKTGSKDVLVSGKAGDKPDSKKNSVASRPGPLVAAAKPAAEKTETQTAEAASKSTTEATGTAPVEQSTTSSKPPSKPATAAAAKDVAASKPPTRPATASQNAAAAAQSRPATSKPAAAGTDAAHKSTAPSTTTTRPATAKKPAAAQPAPSATATRPATGKKTQPGTPGAKPTTAAGTQKPLTAAAEERGTTPAPPATAAASRPQTSHGRETAPQSASGARPTTSHVAAGIALPETPAGDQGTTPAPQLDKPGSRGTTPLPASGSRPMTAKAAAEPASASSRPQTSHGKETAPQSAAGTRPTTAYVAAGVALPETPAGDRGTTPAPPATSRGVSPLPPATRPATSHVAAGIALPETPAGDRGTTTPLPPIKSKPATSHGNAEASAVPEADAEPVATMGTVFPATPAGGDRPTTSQMAAGIALPATPQPPASKPATSHGEAGAAEVSKHDAERGTTPVPPADAEEVQDPVANLERGVTPAPLVSKPMTAQSGAAASAMAMRASTPLPPIGSKPATARAVTSAKTAREVHGPNAESQQEEAPAAEAAPLFEEQSEPKPGTAKQAAQAEPELEVRSLPFTLVLKDGCDHSKHPDAQVRLVSWPRKEVLVFCGFNCESRAACGSRVVAITHDWDRTQMAKAEGVPWTLPLSELKDLEEAFAGAGSDDLHWLDILCVDQESPVELMAAARQVAKVFGEADAVNLWLPGCSAWPFLGMVPLDGETSSQHGSFLSALVPPKVSELVHKKLEDSLRERNVVDREAPGVMEMFVAETLLSNWFMRVWTTQEWLLAKRLTFFHQTVDMDIIRKNIEGFLESYDADPWMKRQMGLMKELLVSSLELKQTLHSTTSPTLRNFHSAIAYRFSTFERDKVITMPPVLRSDISLPTNFDPLDRSSVLAERLWHHFVHHWIHAHPGDRSLLDIVSPGPASLSNGLWHAPINPLIFQRCPDPTSFDDKKAVHQASYDLSLPETPEKPAVLQRVRMIPCRAVWYFDKRDDREQTPLRPFPVDYFTIGDSFERVLRKASSTPPPSIEAVVGYVKRSFTQNIEGMGAIVFPSPSESSAVAVAWLGVEAHKAPTGSALHASTTSLAHRPTHRNDNLLETATLRMAVPESVKPGVAGAGYMKVRLYGSLGDASPSPDGTGEEGFAGLKHSGLVGAAWVDVEGLAAEAWDAYPVVNLGHALRHTSSKFNQQMQLWKIVVVAAAVALANTSDIGAEASPALRALRRRQAAGNLYDSYTVLGRVTDPLASEEVYNLLPDPCKPLMASYTGTYATQEDLGKCSALLKKGSVGRDAYLYIKNHTNLISTLPWQESIYKNTINATLDQLKNIADQADSSSSNNWNTLINNINKAIYPVDVPTQTRARVNVLNSGYIMLQPFALAARPGGEVFAAALTQTLLSFSNLDQREAIRFFNARSPSADIESYVGWVVDSINGKNPREAASSVLDNTPVYTGHYAFVSTYLQYENRFFEYSPRDNGTFGYQAGVLSYLGSNQGGYTISSYFQNPVTYVLRNPSTNATVTHTFPWIVWPSRGYEWLLGEALLQAFDIPLPRNTQKLLRPTSSIGSLPTSTGTASSLVPPSTSKLSPPVITSVPSNETAVNATSRVARRQINQVSDFGAYANASRTLSYLLPQNSSRLGPNVFQVDQQTLAVTLFHPKGSLYDYLTCNYTSEFRSDNMDDFLRYFERMDAALETAVKSNPNIKNVILDLTEWGLENEMLAMAYYFFGSTVKPLEYAFRLTPLVEAILKGFYASADTDGYQDDYTFPVFNTSQHAPPSTSPSSATFDTLRRPTFPTTNIVAQAKTITVNGSPVKVSGRFVPSNLLAAVSIIQPRMQRLPRLATAAGKSNGAYFDPSSITILTNADTCTGKCEEFVRIARTQFKIRTVTLGNKANGVVSGPSRGIYNQPFVYLHYLFQTPFFERYVSSELTFRRTGVASSLPNAPAPAIEAAKEVVSLLPSGFSVEPFSFNPINPPKVLMTIPLHLVYDAGAPDDAVPLGLGTPTEADVTLKDVWRYEWPMGVWKLVVNTPTQNVATLKPDTSIGVNGTSTATVTGTGGKSAGFAMKASLGLMPILEILQEDNNHFSLAMDPDGGKEQSMQPSQFNDTLFNEQDIDIELNDADIEMCFASVDLHVCMDNMEDVVATPPAKTVTGRDEIHSHASQSAGSPSIQDAAPLLSGSLSLHVPMFVEQNDVEVVDLTVPEKADPTASSVILVDDVDRPMAIVVDSDDESVHKAPSVSASKVTEGPQTESKEEEAQMQEQQDEALAAIPNCYRILEVFKDHGSNGLVDKIIIAQESLKELCNRMAKSSFRAINKIDFDALANVNVHFAGVYGNREPLAKLLLHLNAITQETFENLLDPVKNAESSWLKNGLYVLLVPIHGTQYAGIVFHWPEQGCYYDDAAGDLKKNMVNLHSFLCKLTKTQFCFLSQRDVDLINWSLNAPNAGQNVEVDDDIDMMEDSDVEDMFFQYSVTRNQERQQDFLLRDGFRLRHPLIQNSFKTAIPIASGTYFSVLTSEYIAEQRAKPLYSAEGSPFSMEKILKSLFSGNRIILGEKLDEADVEAILKMVLPRDEANTLLEPLMKFRHDYSRMMEQQVDKVKTQQEVLGESIIDAFLFQFVSYLRTRFPRLEAFAEDKGQVLAELIADQKEHKEQKQIVVTMEEDTDFPLAKASAAPSQVPNTSVGEPLFVGADTIVKDSMPPTQPNSLDVKILNIDAVQTLNPTWLKLFEKDASGVNSNEWRVAKRRLLFCKEFVSFLSEGKEVPPLAEARMIADLFLDESKHLRELQEKCFESHALHADDAKNPPKSQNRSFISRIIGLFSDRSSEEMKIDWKTRNVIKDRAQKAFERTLDTAFFDAILEYVALAKKAALTDGCEESLITLAVCTQVAQRFSLIYQERRENLRRKYRESCRRNTAEAIETEKKRLLREGMTERAAIIKSDVIPEINRMLAQRSIGNREACIESFSQIARPHSYGLTILFQYRLETIEPPKIRYYAVRAAIDQAEARMIETNNADETFVPNPRLRGSGKEAVAAFFELDPTKMELLKVFDLQNKSFLVFLREISTGSTFVYYGTSLRDVGTPGARPWKKYARPITHISLDEEKGLLAFYDKDKALLNVMCFDETFRELYTKYAKIEIARWYNDQIPDIADMIFIPGSEEICFVERSGRVRIYSLVTTDFKPVTLTLLPNFLRLMPTQDGSCLLAFYPVGTAALKDAADSAKDSDDVHHGIDASAEPSPLPFEKKVEVHIYFCSRLSNRASKILALPPQITTDIVPQLQMVHLFKRQLHLVCVTEGMLYSIIADITLERHRWQFKADKRRKELKVSESFPGKAMVLAEDPRIIRGVGTSFTANTRIDDFITVAGIERRKIIKILDDEAIVVDRPLMTVCYGTELEYVIEQRTGSNSLLNVYQKMYTKFPIQSCVEREANDISRVPKRLFIMLPDELRANPRQTSLPEELFDVSASAEELAKLQKYATSYFRSTFAELKRTTSKNIKPIAGFEVVVKRQSEIQRTFFESCCKQEVPVPFSNWLLAIFCLIPIQIAVAIDNRFVPLSNGIITSDINQEDTASIAEKISFGWYESIFEFCRDYEVKVVSSMGEQSCGKSYMLNHLLGTAFDGSAMRCTEGAWMSFSLDHGRKTIYVGLDFEGLQSIERSHQEDAMLAVFNCAVSNLVLMKTHFSLGRDLTSMFQRFQDGATLFDATSGKKMFTSRLALIIKDVAEADMRGIVEEFEGKFSEMVAREEEDNFVTRLHGSGMTIWPYPLFNNPAFYAHFAGIKKMLDAQSSKYPKARLFAQTLKLIMAKLN